MFVCRICDDQKVEQRVLPSFYDFFFSFSYLPLHQCGGVMDAAATARSQSEKTETREHPDVYYYYFVSYKYL